MVFKTAYCCLLISSALVVLSCVGWLSLDNLCDLSVVFVGWLSLDNLCGLSVVLVGCLWITCVVSNF